MEPCDRGQRILDPNQPDSGTMNVSESERAESVQQVGKFLTPEAQRFFNHIDRDMAAGAFDQLTQESETILLEVACSPESRLSACVQETAGRKEAAVRCAQWNGCDLGTGAGVKMILGQIDRLKPKHVYISPECGPYSPIQNMNQRTEMQKQELETKRREVLKQYVGASCVYQHCIQSGIHVTWEWSERCQAWRLPLVQKLQEKYQPFVVVTHGCRVNLRDNERRLLRKGWKLMTTHKRVAEFMDQKCSCPKGYRHGLCEGEMTRKSAYYTHEFVKRFVEAIRYELTGEQVREELKGSMHVPQLFGSGENCYCHDLDKHGMKLKCGSCHTHMMHDMAQTPHDMAQTQHDTEMHHMAQTPQNPKSSEATGHEVYVHEKSIGVQRKKDEELKKKLYLLHAATGHCSIRNMLVMLKKRGASQTVLDAAQKFRCSICEEKQKMNSKPAATLEALPPKWAVVCADGGHWTHDVTKETVGFAVMIDEGSRFRAARILCRGKKQSLNASQFIQYFQEGWTQYFGKPHTLRLDPAGAFRSNELEAYCDAQSIFLDFIPAEAHWKFGICEQAVKGLKEVMNKLVSADGNISPEEALSTAVRTFNERDVIRGYSPIQHALGIAPDATGRFINSLEDRSREVLIGNPTGEFQETIERMKTAEQAHSEWVAKEKIGRALNSRGQRKYHYSPGDLVYYWRKQLPKGMISSKTGGFLGPARVLVTETKREADGQLRAGSTVWVVRGRRLLKCCVEQLRPATERETLVEHLATDEDSKAPWTLPRMVEHLDGHEYEDVSKETPSQQQWEQSREDEPMPELASPRQRLNYKRPVAEHSREPQVSQKVKRETSPGATSSDAQLQAEAWWNDIDFKEPAIDAMAYWSHKDAAIEVNTDMPTSNRGWKQLENDLYGYVVTALRRRAVELSEKRMDPETRAQFEGAKGVEVKNFIAAKAFEALPPHLQPPKEQAVGMRWILTWKLKDDGSTKPKARAILLGYQDWGYEHRATTTPVMTKQSRQFLLQAAAIRKWKTQKGDVSGAFLQGREYPTDLYCIPCPEICKAMNLPEGSITKVKRGCYGLVDAPLEWYRSIATFLQTLGLEKTWSDPCMWIWRPEGKVRGIISCHVDDFLFTGGRHDTQWEAILQKIRTQYTWGEWESRSFVQCGVLIEEQEDNSYHLSQPNYTEKVHEIPISASRRRENSQPLTGYEQTQLRAALGSLSWHAQQVAPHFSAEVGMLLSEVANGTVDTIIRTNKLVYAAKNRKNHRMVIHHFPETVEVGLFVWADAAGQNRKDGSSTQGLFLGLAPVTLLEGKMEKVTPIGWHATKIDRVVRSPGAAEAASVVNGEDLLYHARHHEITIQSTDVFNINDTVNKVAGTVISDSRNVYDKLQTEEFSTQGAERRTNLELMCVKHAQRHNMVQLRWVHSEAQLGNALTKAQAKELEHFYQLGCRWRIVSDEEMRSARKRKQKGMDVLENTQHTHQSTQKHTAQYTM